MGADGIGMAKKWAHMIATILLVIGGLVWGGVGLFGVNVVAAVLGRGLLANIVYVLVGVAAIVVAVDRSSYLPFLGETVMPCSLLSERVP